MSAPAVRFRCRSLAEARRVVSLISKRNISPENIQVLSAEPLHDVGEAISGKSRLPLFALTGAALGAAAGYGLAAGTARLYPINTGGMPVLSLLPVGIVTYEMMMLVAVLFTLGGVLFEGKLISQRPLRPNEFGDAIVGDEVLILVLAASPEEADALRIAVDSGRYDSEV